MNSESWDELKAHAKKQHEIASNISHGAGRLIAHVWKDVLNKIWSIEKKGGVKK